MLSLFSKNSETFVIVRNGPYPYLYVDELSPNSYIKFCTECTATDHFQSFTFPSQETLFKKRATRSEVP